MSLAQSMQNKHGMSTMYKFRDQLISLHRHLEKAQWWATDRVISAQLTQMGRLVQHFGKSSPWYASKLRAVNHAPGDLTSLDALIVLPILDYASVATAGEPLFSTDVPTAHGVQYSLISHAERSKPLELRTTDYHRAFQDALVLRQNAWIGRSFSLNPSDDEQRYEIPGLGLIASPCPEQGALHIQSEAVLLEIVDSEGRHCAQGETGRILLSDLQNFASPILRFESGDSGAFGPACSCGRALPVLKELSQQREWLVPILQPLREVLADGNMTEAAFTEAMQLLEKGDNQVAIAAFRKLLERNPGHALAHFNMGLLMERTGDQDAALAAYKDAVKQDPNMASAWNNMGVILDGRGEYTEAISHYRSTVAAKPDHAGAWANLCHALKSTARLPEAIEAGYKAISIAPDMARAHNNLGVALMASQEHQEAESAFRKVLTIDPGSSKGLHNLATNMQNQGIDKSAEEHFENLHKLAPDYLTAYTNHSWTQIQLGNFGRAIQVAMEGIIRVSRLTEAVNRQIGKPLQVKLPSDNSLEALLAAKAALEKVGVPWFVSFGTLLGFVRDGDFISYDTDIDLGVWPDAPLDRIVECMCEHEFVLRPKYLNGEAITLSDRVEGAVNVALYFRDKIALDIYVHFPAKNKIRSGMMIGPETLWFEVSKFTTEFGHFLGHQFPMPGDPERYLQENYGEWRIPDPDYVFLFAPNIVGGYPLCARAFAHHKLCALLVKRNYQRAIPFLDKLIAHENGNAALETVRERLLERA